MIVAFAWYVEGIKSETKFTGTEHNTIKKTNRSLAQMLLLSSRPSETCIISMPNY